jgi:SAM-dependent methyltransferase
MRHMRGAQSVTSSTRPGGRLEAYFDGHTTGLGIWKWRHYFEIYDKHFARFAGNEPHILEIGVYSGGSLDMWMDYLGPGCSVYGVDIDPACRAYEKESVKIFIGDQADPEFWRSFRKEAPQLDIILDDGGHMPHQQIASFESLFGHLRPGGVYVCEDLAGTDNGFHRYVCALARNLNAWEVPELSPTQRAIEAIHLYPFMAVIEKRASPLAELSSPRHGTQWQPFTGGDRAVQVSGTGIHAAAPSI